MANIQNAILESRRMGRDPYGLYCVFDKDVDHDAKRVIVKAKVGGHNENHECEIQWPVKNPWFPTKLNLVKRPDAFWSCDCMDFQCTFYPALKSSGDHIYDWPTDMPNYSGRVRAITDHGVCKHIMCLVDDLIEHKEVLLK